MQAVASKCIKRTRSANNKREKHKESKNKQTGHATVPSQDHNINRKKQTRQLQNNQLHFFMVLNALGTETTGVLSPTSPRGTKNFPHLCDVGESPYSHFEMRRCKHAKLE